MPGGLSEPMEPRFRGRRLRLLGTLTVLLALTSCGLVPMPAGVRRIKA